MKKNYYIFVLTFLCMFVGQMVYGQDDYEDEYTEDGNICDPRSDYYDAELCIQLEEVEVYQPCDSRHPDYYNNLCECEPEWCEELDEVIIYSKCDERNPNYYDNLCECEPEWCEEPTYEEPYEYDPCDPSTYNQCECDPASCEDSTPPQEEPEQNTTVYCTKTCESGYKLDEDTCECKLLLPCFGSTNSGSVSNPAIVDEIGNILNTLGLGGDVKSAVIALASGDVTDISDYLEQLKNISKGIAIGSVAISITNYYNEPTTQNLLQILFDTGAAMVTFASGPTAVVVGPFVSFATSFSNASGATSYVLGNLANLIDRSVDCNVGQGLRFIFEP